MSLNDSWSTNGYVHVSFSGAVIEEKSKEVETVEISHLDTKVDTTESVELQMIKALRAGSRSGRSSGRGKR